MRIIAGALVLTVAALVSPLQAQNRKKEPKFDQIKVDEAIKKGVAFLKTYRELIENRDPQNRPAEILLLTFLHAGVPEDDADVEKLLAFVLETPLTKTYCTSLQAMILEDLDAARYQERIAQCAQFLVDNQCKNGMWSYGDPSAAADAMTPKQAEKPKDVASEGGGEKPKRPSSSSAAARGKTRALKPIQIVKKRDGPEWGDNSNTQYAALGLRACFDAGIVFPREICTLGRKWWYECQYSDGGWSYGSNSIKPVPYGSMTVGGVGSLAIYDFMLGEDPRADRKLQKGIGWLTKNYSLTENRGPCDMEQAGGKPTTDRCDHYIYYYLYGLERAGILAATETFGAREWYPEGVDVLLKAQQADGSWHDGQPGKGNSFRDTCFAILFLKRAIRPLIDVATAGGRGK